MSFIRLAWFISFVASTTVSAARTSLGLGSVSTQASDTLTGLKLGGDFDLDNHFLLNVPTPTSASHAVNKSYADALINGLDWKASVRAMASTNVNLASPGTSIGGVSLSNPSRVLLTGQSIGSQNGVYVWTGSGTPMNRATDMDASSEVTAGLAVYVSEGTGGNTAYILTTDDTITLDTTALTFVAFSGISLDSSSTPLAAAPTGSPGNSSLGAPANHQHPFSGEEILRDGSVSFTGVQTQAGVKVTYASHSGSTFTVGASTNTEIWDSASNAVNGTLPTATGSGRRIAVLWDAVTANAATVTAPSGTVQDAALTAQTSFNFSAGDMGCVLLDAGAGKWIRVPG